MADIKEPKWRRLAVLTDSYNTEPGMEIFGTWDEEKVLYLTIDRKAAMDDFLENHVLAMNHYAQRSLAGSIIETLGIESIVEQESIDLPSATVHCDDCGDPADGRVSCENCVADAKHNARHEGREEAVERVALADDLDGWLASNSKLIGSEDEAAARRVLGILKGERR